MWLVEDGAVAKYDGYFDDYRDELLKEISAEMEADEREAAAAAAAKRDKEAKAAAGGGGEGAGAGGGYVNPLISNPALL